MADPTKQERYYDCKVGETFIRPIIVRLQATFSSGVATKDETRRRSDPNITIAKSSTGNYAIAAIPLGADVHVLGCHLDPGADNPADTDAQLGAPRSFSATAGTGIVLFTRPDTGALADPPDGSRLYLTLEVETGLYT